MVTAPDDGAVAGTARTGPDGRMQGHGVSGHVRSSAGGPIEMATVTVIGAPDAAGPVPQQAGVTDCGGGFFYPLSPGGWVLLVSAFGHQPVTVVVDVPDAGQAAADVVLEPERG